MLPQTIATFLPTGLICALYRSSWDMLLSLHLPIVRLRNENTSGVLAVEFLESVLGTQRQPEL